MRRLRNFPACRSQGLTSVTIVPLESIQYDDYPEIRVNEHERTEMPFRYVKDADGQPIMPPVCSIRLYGVHILTIIHREWLISSRRMPTKAWMIFSNKLYRVHAYMAMQTHSPTPTQQGGTTATTGSFSLTPHSAVAFSQFCLEFPYLEYIKKKKAQLDLQSGNDRRIHD